MRIVLDTNVLIAASLKGGFSEEILQISQKSKSTTLICSQEILEELQNKLISKFKWLEYDAKSFANRIRIICQLIEIKERLNVVTRDPKDDKILEYDIVGKADIIVTADQDLIRLKEFRGIAIVHPKILAWTFPQYLKRRKQ